MAPKANEENERIKHQFLAWQRDAKRCDETTVDKFADAIARFERATGHKSFKSFRVEWVTNFKRKLEAERNLRTNAPLSKATISGVLRSLKAFFEWLSQQPGYKTKIRYTDAEYFNLNAKDARVAHAVRHTPYPTLQQCAHAFALMPNKTEVDQRNRAIFAFLMLTGARDGAIASVRLKRIDLVEMCFHQDGRDVKTKFAKTFTTWFLPIGQDYLDCFAAWVEHLRNDRLFGHEDALFPKLDLGLKDGVFAVTGLSREPYANASAIRQVIKNAFANAGLPVFAPHSFRKTLVKWADRQYPSREAFKAFAQNIGHESALTTISAYLPVSTERQAELIRGA